MNLIGAYKNGNYNVFIFDDGTKIIKTDEKEFIPDRLESVDMKITNMCDMGCPMCHEMSTPNGKHGNINHKIIDTFLPYTEIAIGGGNPLSHPELDVLLQKLKDLKCFANITVNQTHFLKNFDRIKNLADRKLINGIGVSLNNVNEEVAEKMKELPNSVAHTIAGITTLEDMEKMSKLGIKKILILGYKIFGRGKDFYNDKIALNVKKLRDRLEETMGMFDVVSFDNLAIHQLDVKFTVGEEKWEECYMGDDGSSTMYIDLVEEKYAKNSTSVTRFDFLDTVNDMFLDIRNRKNNSKEDKYMFDVGDKVIVSNIGEVGTVVRVDKPQPNYLIKFDDPRYTTCTYYESELEQVTLNSADDDTETTTEDKDENQISLFDSEGEKSE